MRRISPTIFLYLLRETLPLTGLTFVVLTVLIVAQQLGRGATLALLSLSTAGEATWLMLLTLPSVCLITLPMALLIGSLMALNRLKADLELTAAAAGGIGPAGLYLALFVLGLGGTAAAYVLTADVGPRATRAMLAFRLQILARGLASRVRPQRFETQFPGYLLHLQGVDRHNGDWMGVFLLRESNGDSLLLTADRGRLRLVEGPDPVLEIELTNGISFTSNEKDGRRAGAVFDRTVIRLSASQDSGEPNLATRLQALGTREIRRAADSSPPAQRRAIELEWHRRLSLPLASVLLSGIAIVIAMRTQKARSKAIGLALGFAISLVYYLCLIAGQNLALAGHFPVWLGVWMPNLLTAATILACAIGLPHLRGFGLLRPIKEASPPSSRAVEKTVSRRRQSVSLPAFRLTALINYLILGEVLRIFLLGAGILVATTIVFTLFDIIPSAARNRMHPLFIAGYLAFLSPQIFYFISPFAFLISVLAAYFILSRTNQLIALAASGVSSLRLALPVLLFGAATAVGLYLLSDAVLPRTNREQDARYQQIKGRKSEQATLALGRRWINAAEGRIIGFLYSEADKRLLNASVYEVSGPMRQLQLIRTFESASYLHKTEWEVSRGWEFRPATGAFSLLERQTLDIGESPEAFRRTVNESSKLTTSELTSLLRQMRRLGIEAHAEQIDLWKRYSHPLTCLTLLLISWPLAAGRRAHTRREGIAGIGFGIMISIAFWLLGQALEVAGKQSLLPVWISVWGAHLLAIPLAFYFFVRRS